MSEHYLRARLECGVCHLEMGGIRIRVVRGSWLEIEDGGQLIAVFVSAGSEMARISVGEEKHEIVSREWKVLI